MRATVRLIDYLLRRSGGLFEFSDNADCVLRIQLGKASHDVTIGSEKILKGETVLAIHIWNEHIPILPKEGANLAWALVLRRRVNYSFREMAKVMQHDSRFSQVKAVWGTSSLFSFTDHIGGVRMMQHLGFTVLPYYNPLGRFGLFWENLFSWWLMWAYNYPSISTRHFKKLQRTEIWITKSEFLKRYGESAIP